MTQWWFDLGRASGIVAGVLMALALVWGLLFSARETGKRLKPAWWLDLHTWLGGLALAFTVVHVVALFFSDVGIGVAQILIPGTSTSYESTGITWGVLAFYGLALSTITSWHRIKRRLPRRVWHLVHLVSIPSLVLVGVHGWASGSDADTFLFEALLVVLAGLAVYPAGLRVIGLVQARQDRARLAARS